MSSGDDLGQPFLSDLLDMENMLLSKENMHRHRGK